ncbi:MAG: nuclear transport factor 2 family protein [Flavobacteriaceae bacterium]|nr:nuclear transport factor 2 family protein [Flavobacteriaceae bacterium]
MTKLEVLQNYYNAFQNLELDKMSNYYHADIEFYDHAFGTLNKNELEAMWSMLFNKAFKDLTLEISDIKIVDKKGFAHVECCYIYSLTNRKVHNIIDTTIDFKEGKIIKQVDIFSLKRWAAQSLGWKQSFFAGTTFFKKRLQKQTRTALDKYLKNEYAQKE